MTEDEIIEKHIKSVIANLKSFKDILWELEKKVTSAQLVNIKNNVSLRSIYNASGMNREDAVMYCLENAPKETVMLAQTKYATETCLSEAINNIEQIITAMKSDDFSTYEGLEKVKKLSDRASQDLKVSSQYVMDCAKGKIQAPFKKWFSSVVNTIRNCFEDLVSSVNKLLTPITFKKEKIDQLLNKDKGSWLTTSYSTQIDRLGAKLSQHKELLTKFNPK